MAADTTTADRRQEHLEPTAARRLSGDELRIVVELAGWEAAGSMPRRHPWLLMRPIVERDLGLTRP